VTIQTDHGLICVTCQDEMDEHVADADGNYVCGQCGCKLVVDYEDLPDA
jgi:DNA-directed RNA polymerase subunit RPC12/RpoP